MTSPLAQAIADRAERAGMSPAAALSYRLGALEARLLIQAAADNALRALNSTSKGTTRNA